MICVLCQEFFSFFFFFWEKKSGNCGASCADDGGGMDPEGIRKCMSLGYSSKKTDTTIGQCNSLIFLLLVGLGC